MPLRDFVQHLQLVYGKDGLQSSSPLQQHIPGLLDVPLHEVGILLQQRRLYQLVQAPEGAVKLPEPLVMGGQYLPCRPPLEGWCLGPAFPPTRAQHARVTVLPE